MADIFEDHLTAALPRWQRSGGIGRHDEVVVLLDLAAQEWAGVPQQAGSVRRARELGAMIQHASSVGPANWITRTHRIGPERWARWLVSDSRTRHDDGTPLAGIAHHRDEAGTLLEVPTAAVELLNVLRPIVAVARFVAFGAVALDAEPQWCARFRSGDVSDLPKFVQEVRRTTPFFPAIAGVADRDFLWEGTTVAAGTRAMADLYGTNNEPRIWPAPRHFDPARFRTAELTAHNLVPQGGGDVRDGHRCPGEDLALQLTARAVLFLARSGMRLPPQDLSVSLHRLPALPASGVVANFPVEDAGPDPVGPAGAAEDGAPNH